MDWNELIRIWGAGHPGQELKVDAAAEDAQRARARRRARMVRAETSTPQPALPEPAGSASPGDEARA